MRAFLALALPDSLRDALVSCREAFLDSEPSWRGQKWVPDANLHVTLTFLGEIAESAVPSVLAAVSRATEGIAPFVLTYGRVVAVPRHRQASILWVTPFEESEPCRALVRRIEDEIARADGLGRDGGAGEPPRDARPFRAHVTLCRARHPQRVSEEALERASAVLTRAPLPMSVGEVTFYASTLTRTGPVYERLGAVALPGV